MEEYSLSLCPLNQSVRYLEIVAKAETMATTPKPISLRLARKERDRAATKAVADANAAKFGRSKAERVLEATRNAQAKARLDQHRLDDE